MLDCAANVADWSGGTLKEAFLTPLPGPMLSLPIAEARARCWEALKMPQRAPAVRERAGDGNGAQSP